MSKSIKFDHADGGEMSIKNGITSLSDILAIGAINLTSKYNIETHQRDYATDTEGLEVIAEKADFAANFLTGSVRSIGVLLASVDSDEITSELKSIAWLITGLSELSIMVNDAQDDINHSLKLAYEANVKNNGASNE